MQIRFVIFVGLIICGLESSDDFVGLYFVWCTYSNHCYIADKQIHKNLNPTEITNHMVYCWLLVNFLLEVLVL